MLNPLRRKRLKRLFEQLDKPAFARAWLDAARRGEAPDEAAPEPLLDDWQEFRASAIVDFEARRSGHVYVAAYVLADDVFKVGLSRQAPDTRVKALKTAGVLAPLVLIHGQAVPDRFAAEAAVHRALSPFRVEREFFAIKANQAIRCVQEVTLHERDLFSRGSGRT